MSTRLPLALSITDLWATDVTSGATLHNVCLEISAGQVMAVEDPKPENIRLLAECLTGDHIPFHGHISVATTELAATDQDALQRWRRSMIHSLDTPLPKGRESVEQYVAAAQRSHAGTDSSHRTRAALERVGLLEVATQSAADLGPAQTLSLALASALIWNPAVLLLTEPQKRLAKPDLKAMIILLGDLVRLEGRTVLIATSSSWFVPPEATRINL